MFIEGRASRGSQVLSLFPMSLLFLCLSPDLPTKLRLMRGCALLFSPLLVYTQSTLCTPFQSTLLFTLSLHLVHTVPSSLVHSHLLTTPTSNLREVMSPQQPQLQPNTSPSPLCLCCLCVFIFLCLCWSYTLSLPFSFSQNEVPLIHKLKYL